MEKKPQQTRKFSNNKGFSGKSSILPRSNFGVGGQDSSLQSALLPASVVIIHFKSEQSENCERI